MSVIVARCSKVLRSSGISLRPVKLTTKSTKDTKNFRIGGTPRRSLRTAHALSPASFITRLCELHFTMGRVSQFLILAVLAAIGCGQKTAPAVDLASERQRM